VKNLYSYVMKKKGANKIQAENLLESI
jgi:hypothetical protein